MAVGGGNLPPWPCLLRRARCTQSEQWGGAWLTLPLLLVVTCLWPVFMCVFLLPHAGFLLTLEVDLEEALFQILHMTC